MLHRRVFCTALVIILLLLNSVYALDKDMKARESFNNAQFDILETYGVERMGAVYMRGFAASKDGKYLYVGLVHHDNGLFRLNSKDGSFDGISYYDEDNGMIKGIATDDRGYVYIGITKETSFDRVSIAVLDKDLNELSYETIEIEGKVGVNGVEVHKRKGRYYMYFITNYETNTIRCYDVTDSKNIKVNKDFGTNGVLNLSTLLGNENAQGNYLKIADDGTVYLTANIYMLRPKGDTLLKIDKDFSKVLKTYALDDAYGIDVYKDYVLISTYSGNESRVCVFNKDIKHIAVIGGRPDSSDYSGVAVAKGRVYISDQNYMGMDRILVSDVISELKPTSYTRIIIQVVSLIILFGMVTVIVYSIKKLKRV